MIGERGAARKAALIGFVLAVAVPGTASAATYCVHASASCPAGEIDKGSNLQGALNDANASLGVNDQVKVGAGSYTGPFSYAGLGGAVQITGVGASTIITAPATNGVTAFGVGNPGSRVENLHINVPLGNTTNTNFGLELNGTADGVSVQIASIPAANVIGVNLLNQGTFRNGSVAGPMPATAPSISVDGVDGSGTFLIEDSTVHIDHAIGGAGGGTLRRLDLQGRVGFQLQSETNNGGSGNFLIEDTLWRSQPGAADDAVVGLLAGCGLSADLQATVRNTTLVDDAAMGSPLTAVCNVPGSSTVDVVSTIAVGGNRLVSSTGAGTASSTLNLAYSDFDPAKLLPLDAGTINQGPGNVNVPPGFLGAGDFRLGSDSPLIDVGDPAGLAAGESPIDLGGGPRILNGSGACAGPRRDIGAYEAAGVAPPASCTPVKKKKCKKPKRKHKRAADAKKHKKKKCKKRKKKR
jgi:hypothetical protein